MMTQWQFKSKVIGFVLVFIGLFLALRLASHNQAFNFSVRKITSHFSHHSAWDLGHISDQELEDIHRILEQPFHYLDAGNFVYVFESEDKEYVIKFFINHQRALKFKDIFNFNRKEKKRQKEIKVCTAYALAYHQMKEDAGLVYLHLNTTNHLHKTIKLIDKLHRVHFVRLDDASFVIQKKAELLFDRIKRLYKHQDLEGVNSCLSDVIHLLERRSAKKLSDDDLEITKNFGFTKEGVIQIGLGGLHIGEQNPGIAYMRGKIDEWFDRQKHAH